MGNVYTPKNIFSSKDYPENVFLRRRIRGIQNFKKINTSIL